MNKDYYTVNQISNMLNIHPKTIQRYIREGKLRAAKVGKGGASQVMILVSSLKMAVTRSQRQRGKRSVALLLRLLSI